MHIFRAHAVKNVLSLLAAVALLNLSVAPYAAADVVTTDAILQNVQIDEKRADIQAFAARNDVRAQLLDLGVSESDITQRIANLSDAEILQMHGQLDSMPAGEGVLGTVIALLVIFMLLDMAGVTDIFPRI